MKRDLKIPEYIKNITDLKILVRTIVEGYYSGIHRSTYKGFSTEFSEHREYLPGDDIRYIDWNVFARRDRYYIKEFEAETSINSILALDKSASMDYKRLGDFTKLEYAIILTACIAYILVRQRDGVGLITYTEKIDDFIPPRSSNYHLNQIYNLLTGIEPGGVTCTSDSLFELGAGLKKRSLVVVLSDLWDETEDIFRIVKAFREKKSEVLIFQILDPFEIEPTVSRSIRFKDVERGRETEYLPGEYLSLYRDRFRERQENFFEGFGEMGVDFLTFTTDTYPVVPLTHFLKKRERQD
jgi:uncharacterized protein (DUF58 family)